mmetsp:Transcript_11151/g.11175  ORF Transcript_11151/g.11175 Transcript_11151/m.11175 type:complete len:299 (+) Transcript_11151:78-974(+)
MSSQISIRKLKDFEKRIREKMSVKTGFSGDEVSAKKLKEVFRHYDIDEVGEIDLPKFIAAMAVLNFVGVQREVEALFHFYDSEERGAIDYVELANGIFGLNTKPIIGKKCREVVDKLKYSIIASVGPSGFHKLEKHFSAMDKNKSHELNRDEILNGFRCLGVGNISLNDIDTIFNSMDTNDKGVIIYDDLLIYLLTGMSHQRKLSLHNLFNALDTSRTGAVFISELLKNCDFRAHPSVIDGTMSEADAREDMISCFHYGGSQDGMVFWQEFLDYHKCISLAIESDQQFEEYLRHTWGV